MRCPHLSLGIICKLQTGLFFAFCQGEDCERRRKLEGRLMELEAVHGIDTTDERNEYEAIKKELGKE